MNRRCNRCYSWKGLEDFPLNPNHLEGRDYTCKLCRRELGKVYGAKYRLTHADSLREQRRKAYHDNKLKLIQSKIQELNNHAETN